VAISSEISFADTGCHHFGYGEGSGCGRRAHVKPAFGVRVEPKALRDALRFFGDIAARVA
jgi:hypothetical protein